MWTGLVMAYAGGVMGTAFFVLRNQILRQSHFMNVGVSLLWPVYWTYFLGLVFQNRRRGR